MISANQSIKMTDHRQFSFPLPKRLQPQSFENRVESRMCGVVRIIWILTFQSCGNINFMNLVMFDCSWLCGLGIWFEYYHNLNFVLFHLKVKSFDVITFHNPTRHFTWQKKQNIQGCTLCNKFLWVRVQLKCHSSTHLWRNNWFCVTSILEFCFLH